MVTTNYRAVSNGYTEFLEYEKEFSFILFKWKRWVRIWYPYYHMFRGNESVWDSDNHVCGYNSGSFVKFKEDLPDIETYFIWARHRQAELKRDVEKKREELDNKNGNIREI